MDNLETKETAEGIAIIGMVGRFPKAGSVDEFWRNVRDGVEAISFFTDEELIASGVSPTQFRHPNYVRAKGLLEDVEYFDASFFGFNPREAEIMDPQQRVFLECAWQALESAGYASGEHAGTVGVYAGVSLDTYLFALFSNPDLIESVGFFHTMLGNDRDYLTTRVSYELNLKGPSLNVQTGCSTSLVAVHLACQSLLDYQCDVALAGGVSITVPKKAGYMYMPGGVASPDGHCRAFDAKAQGTINGNGVGIVVLKRLEEALEDGDTIHAVIKGSAINNDGALKVGFTAPSVEGQAHVIAEAQAVAGISADSISYIEAHGTGTVLGDPIEVAALTKAFRASTDRKQFCALGSVKTNIGHLDAAAGVTGLIKATLALSHRQLPPSLHFEHPNPNIDFLNSPFYVNAKLADWVSANNQPRRAGVSSFGIGGTNAHVILEEAPPLSPSTASSRALQLLTLSAKSETVLRQMQLNLAQHLSTRPELALADVAATLQMGRRAFAHRFAAVCGSVEEAINALNAGTSANTGAGTGTSTSAAHGVVGDARPSVAMMFPGQGAQYVDMGRELYATEAVFRQEVDACAEVLMEHLGEDIRQVMFGESGAGEQEQQEQSERLKQTQWAQPALFTIEYALARQWMAWGVQPAAMIGHSVGEYVAACLAGVFKLSDALRIVAARGRLMQGAEKGAMAAVTLSEAEVEKLLKELERDGRVRAGAVEIAAVNAPRLCVVTGEEGAIGEVEREVERRGEGLRRLHTSHAFHSWMMEGAAKELAKEFERVEWAEAELRYVENVSGGWAQGEEVREAGYWVRQMREGVRFSAGVEEIKKEGVGVWLEVGPGRSLGTLVKRHEGTASQLVLSSLDHPQEQQSKESLPWRTLSQLWVEGVEIDWRAYYEHERRRRVPLPTYPFERQRYWVEGQSQDVARQSGQPKMGKRADIAEWFYAPVWKQSFAASRFRAADEAAQATPQAQHALVFADEAGLDKELASQLEQKGYEVTFVRAGSEFRRTSDGEYTLPPGQRAGYDSLLTDLYEHGKKPNSIIHLWSVTADHDTPADDELFEQSQQRGFYSLLYLAQALGEQTLAHSREEQGDSETLQLCVVSNNLHAVTGEEILRPEKATLLGPCRVIAQEYPQITSRSIDVVTPQPGTKDEQRLAAQLVEELTTESSDVVIAYRGQHRWVQTFEEMHLDGGRTISNAAADMVAGHVDGATKADAANTAVRGMPPRLREHGVYLITGGTGGIGLELAKHLAETARARLVLIGRTPLPEREQWETWIAEHGEGHDLSRRLQNLQVLEETGAEVLVIAADVGDEAEMRDALGRARERFGEINGVIHAAGLPGGGLIQLQTEEAASAVLKPKVNGTRVLDVLFRDQPLDFIALFSSHRSILGGLGRVDYSAANAFLDAYARAKNGSNGTYACSIIWDGWKEVGMAVDAARRHNLTAEEAIEEGMTTSEGIEAFRRVLSSALPQVVVSTQDFLALVKQSQADSASNVLEMMDTARQTQAKHSRPNIQTPYVAPTNEAERIIADIWQQLLGIEPVGINDNFFELGGDSVLSIQIVAKANKVRLHLTPQQIFTHQTIAELAAVAGTAQKVRAEQGAVTGEVPPTPIQHWFFELNPPNPHHWNQALLLEVRDLLDAALLKQTVERLLQHHDALRMRFTRSDSVWQQFNAPAEETTPFSHLDFSSVAESELTEAIETAAAEAQASLNLGEGPLLRVVYFDMGAERSGRLLIVIHHLVIDAISWRILLEDLATAYEQLRRGERVTLPAKTTSFKSWAEALQEYARSEAAQGELSYWLSPERRAISRLPVDFPGAEQFNKEESAHTLQIALSAEETRALLQDVPQAYHTQINDVLLTALAQVLTGWTGQRTVLVDLEGHGRDTEIEGIDVTRTVGWFTTIYPVLLELAENGNAGESLKRVKELLRALPGRSISYGLLRFMHPDDQVREQMRALPQAEVSFLYLGQTDQSLPESTPFAAAAESSGPMASPGARRSHLITISGLITGGQLQLGWTYSDQMHRRSTIEQLSRSYLNALRELIEHCLSAGSGGYTPSDFPDAELSQSELDELMAELSQQGK